MPNAKQKKKMAHLSWMALPLISLYFLEKKKKKNKTPWAISAASNPIPRGRIKQCQICQLLIRWSHLSFSSLSILWNGSWPISLKFPLNWNVYHIKVLSVPKPYWNLQVSGHCQYQSDQLTSASYNSFNKMAVVWKFMVYSNFIMWKLYYHHANMGGSSSFFSVKHIKKYKWNDFTIDWIQNGRLVWLVTWKTILYILLQMVSLMIEALAWFLMLVMISVETKTYIQELRWYVRFGVIYLVVGDVVMLGHILSMKDFYSRWVAFKFIY